MNAANFSLPGEQLGFWVDKYGDRAVLHQPADGKYYTYTWRQIQEEALKLSAFFTQQGWNKGDKVAILAKNCAEWIVTDIAMMLSGVVSVPIYPTANTETIAYILEHSESKAIVVGKLDDTDAASAAIPESMPRVGMPFDTVRIDNAWHDIMASVQPATSTADVTESDLMTILYTSGSTGQPKGAMHSYSSFVMSGKNTGACTDIRIDDRILSYLPMSHCTERCYINSVFLNYGLQLYFTESLATFADNLNYCRPTLFGSVPRLWTQFQKKILAKMPNKKLQFLLKIPIVGSIVSKKIRTQMGLEQARSFISGSAPLSGKVLEWYRGIGIDIAEGWGMTETFAVGCVPHKGRPVRFGTISQPTKGAEFKIEDDEEILIKCPSVMMGYYKDEAKTAETISEDGFVRTGDLGKMEDGYVSIVGRKKDIFKTEKGKYVAPIPIESEFGENEYIEQMCLMGTQLVQPVLVANLSEHASSEERATLQDSLLSSLNHINGKLEPHEKVGGIIITANTWTTETGELTPTLKVKRHIVEKRYLDAAKEVPQGQIVWQ